MRRDPVYLTTFTGRPPDEPSVIGAVLNDLALPTIIRQLPEVTDVWLPPERGKTPMKQVHVVLSSTLRLYFFNGG
jgi:4-hydroxy-3-polyprenylbenzoate decarboxylase